MCIRIFWATSRSTCRRMPHLIEIEIHGAWGGYSLGLLPIRWMVSAAQLGSPYRYLLPGERRGLGRKYYALPLDAANRSGIVRSCSVHIPFTKSSGGTHGKRAAGTSGRASPGRRRVSASGRAAPSIRSRTSTNLQIRLPQRRRPPRRNQTAKNEAPLQG